jgi:CubicO group peptidase (beta-lactamase class C family)
MKTADQLMQQAVTEDVFPGGVLLVSKNVRIVFCKAYGFADIFTKRKMTKDTIFDLASLTKPLATTLAVMMLIQQEKINLEQTLGSILPRFKNTEKDKIRIDQLLAHVSGLPDYRPYYLKLIGHPPQKRNAALKEYLLDEPLLTPIGAKVVYSDLGFMILKWVVESVWGMRFDRLVHEQLYYPLDIHKLFFIDLAGDVPEGYYAATEQCPWRKILLNGQVHDENAYAMGGIEGHAGLFGTAGEVHRLLSILLAVYQGNRLGAFVRKDILQLFFKRQDFAGRALGFDSPDRVAASCGKYFSETSVGHLGFTGTSFWMDLDKSVIVILLTNRVHPSRDNDKIKAFRPDLHDAVMSALVAGY